MVFSLLGTFGHWKTLGSFLDNPLYGIQFTPTTPWTSIRAMAGFYTQVLSTPKAKGMLVK